MNQLLNVEFWKVALKKAKKFFSLCILPDLIEENGTCHHQHLHISFIVMRNWLMMLIVMKRKVLGVTAGLIYEEARWLAVTTLNVQYSRCIWLPSSWMFHQKENGFVWLAGEMSRGITYLKNFFSPCFIQFEFKQSCFCMGRPSDFSGLFGWFGNGMNFAFAQIRFQDIFFLNSIKSIKVANSESKFCLETKSIVLVSSLCSGHWIRKSNLNCITSIHLLNILDALKTVTLKQNANLAKDHLIADVLNQTAFPGIGIMHRYLCWQHGEQ